MLVIVGAGSAAQPRTARYATAGIGVPAVSSGGWIARSGVLAAEMLRPFCYSNLTVLGQKWSALSIDGYEKSRFVQDSHASEVHARMRP